MWFDAQSNFKDNLHLISQQVDYLFVMYKYASHTVTLSPRRSKLILNASFMFVSICFCVTIESTKEAVSSQAQ